MNHYSDEQFAAAATGVDFPEYAGEEFLAHEPGGYYLKRYILVEHFPKRFGAEDDVTVFYNKYYLFLKFYQAYKITHGNNAGMEQQAFKILEKGEWYDDIDWAVVETIVKEFEP